MRLNPDGSVSVLTGQVDIAGTNIALAQIAASAYGIDVDKIRITTGDTDTAPMTGLSAGSKTVYTVGAAVLEAAQDARRQTLEIAAAEMEASVHDLEIEDGRVVVRGVPDRAMTTLVPGWTSAMTARASSSVQKEWTPGPSAPSMGGRAAREPVAITQLSYSTVAPSSRVSVRAPVSSDLARRPSMVLTFQAAREAGVAV